MSRQLHEIDKQMSHASLDNNIIDSSSSSNLFVYEITARHVQVRSEPCEHARIDDYILQKGQLVAAYQVTETMTDDSLCTSTSTNHKYKTGPYLKLADGSGYIFENKAVGAGTLLQTICEQLPVTRLASLSTSYVHPSLTVELRTHPNVSSAMLRTLDPLQKVTCEIKLKHKDSDWYHVQLRDGTQGWVARQALSDTNADESYDNGMSTHEQLDDESSPTRQHDRLNLEHEPLIPESCIQFGLFAYVALQPIAIRASPTVSNASRTGVIVETNDVTLATVVVREKRASDEYEAYNDTAPINGPFLYLPRLGWAFEHKDGRPIMQKLGVAQGAWKLTVLRQGVYPCLGPVLCASRSNHHVQKYFLREKNDASNDEPTLYAAGTELSSDVCVASNGATYYRVTDRPHHWICQANEQDGQLEVVRTCHANDTGVERKISVSVQKSSERDLNERSTSSESVQHDGWTEDFVRGVASLMEGLTTKLAPEPGKLVYMKNKVTIQIECRARFVTVRANEHSSTNYPECTSKQLSMILSDPLHATAESAIPMKIPPPVRFAAPFSSTSSRNESDGSVKSILHSQLTDVEEQLAHHAARKRELESAIQQIEWEESGGADVSATKLSASMLQSFGLADHAGSVASTEGSRTVSYGSTSSSVDTTPHRGKPVIASEVNLVCGVCHHEFTYPRERRKHCLDVHGLLSCNFCTAVFESKAKLHAHRDDRDHW